MSSAPSSISTTLTCTQCGGELHPDEGQVFITCPYCAATVYIDKSRVVFHWYLAPTVNDAQARENLARWMAGSQTVKDLDKKAQVVGQAFQYFPVWHIRRQVNGREQVELHPAAAISITELRNLPLTAGDLRKYDASIEQLSVNPTVPLEAALQWAQQGAANNQVLQISLVHVPLYTFKYRFQNQVYTALVEAASGKVIANLFPAKAEAPYLVAGGITGLVFLCLAFIPVMFNGSSGSLLACLGLGALAAPLLLLLAAWVAAKV